jgi:UDP-N-acetylmuramate dehydrogenase
MNIFKGLEEIVEKDYPLEKESWYGLGGNADYFIRAENTQQLKDVVKRCSENKVPIYVLGNGSNLLISDKGLTGAVVKLDGEEFTKTEYNGSSVSSGAAVSLGELVLECTRKGLSGIEGLTGIPGTVGGAVKMNAGGRFGDIGSSVEEVTLMDSLGNIFKKSKPELIFDYRSVNITAPFIIEARFELAESEPEQIMQNVKEVWIYKKNNQPLNTKNTGCIFKNPRGASAGALIDRAGLKGERIGGAVISEKHANFIVAEDGCKSDDVLALIDKAKKQVKEQFQTELQLEIQIWE